MVALAGVEPPVRSLTVMVAALVPGVVGLNTTWIVQVSSESSGSTQPSFVITNSVALAPPITLVKTPEAVPPALPTLKIVTWLVAPTSAENEAGVGAMVRIGGVTTVVVTDTFLTVVPPLHTMVSGLGPAVAALNVKPKAQGMFAGTVAGQVVFVGSAVTLALLGTQARPGMAPVAVTVTVNGTD
jgi:hypothetical protein